jgi:hypothetical protein
MIAHLLGSIPYHPVDGTPIELPDRPAATSGYERPPRDLARPVPDHAASLVGDPERDD